jgi:hypothetical protein
VILIGLGVVFLLNNPGILNWSVWDVIFRLWPVLLIAAGLDILIGRRADQVPTERGDPCPSSTT